MITSYNGYPASKDPDDFGGLDNRTIGDSGVRLRPGLRKGAVADVLFYVAEQLHERVERAELFAQGDDWGYSFRKNVNADNYSCHASGTAFDYNATRHPNNVPSSRNYSKAQIAEIHQILMEVDNVVRWGGDFKSTVDAMHFEINAPLEKVQRVAEKLTLRQKSLVNGDGKVTIEGKIYDDITTVSAEVINEAKLTGNMSRHVFRMQVWLRNVGYWPKGGNLRLDGRWARTDPDRGAEVLQQAIDTFRWDHRAELGISDRAAAQGTVGPASLSLLRQLNDTRRYPIRQES
ncbi:MAG: M15 family metallopeptidase [Propionibacteriaceae bacterium]